MSVIDQIEKFFDGMGLMTGNYAIAKRLLFGALLGGILITYIKPSIMFTEEGEAKSFGLEETEETTVLPWFIVPLIGAILSGVFI